MLLVPCVIEEKSKADGSLYLRIKDEDGKWHTSWQTEDFSYFIEGQPVNVDITTKGAWSNLYVQKGNQPKDQPSFKAPSKQESNKEPDWNAIRAEKSEGQAKGAAFNKSVDVAIAIYQKGEIKVEDIVPMVKKIFVELKTINQNGNE